MNWIDTLLATPTIGVAFSPSYDRFFSFPTNLGKYWDFVISQNGSLNYSTSNSEYIINQNDEFTFKVRPNDISATFSYRLSPENDPGKLPTVPHRDLVPYSSLLQSTQDVFNTFYKHFTDKDSTSIIRIGIVAIVAMSPNDVPPGILDFLKHVSDPWKKEIAAYDINTKFVLSDTETHKDLCGHRVANAEQDKKGILCVLDWQRFFSTLKPFTAPSLKSEIETCSNMALKYFEEFGKGNWRE